MTDMVRETLTEISVLDALTNTQIVDEIVAYFDRQRDIALVKSAIKTRYGIGIKPVEDPNDSLDQVETYAKTGFHEQVDAGLIESIPIGFGAKVASSLGRMFTEKGQTFTLIHESVEDTTEAQTLLELNRENGGFDAAITDADSKAVQIGSAAVMLSFTRQSMRYKALPPSVIRAFFGEYITEDGIKRSANNKDIEDASVVIIRLGVSQLDIGTYRYLAIFGRSDIYPDGRYVEYIAKEGSTDIPAPYDEGTIEYEIEGTMCNPLSYLANMYPDMDIPEYPIVILYGCHTDSDDVMPVSTTLYETSLEFDVGGSHTQSTAQGAAVGTTVITRDEQGAGKPLPRSTYGPVALEVGLGLKHEAHDSNASMDAVNVQQKHMIQSASGYSVPDYMVVNDDNMFESSSGVALEVKTQPLIDERKKRIKRNKLSVRKIFEIEKSLINLFSEADESAINLMFQCKQVWDAGKMMLPENKKEAADRIKVLMEKGVLDTVAAIQEYYQYPTEADAIEMYEKMKERKTKYPPLVEADKKPQVGLTRGARKQPALREQDQE